VAEGSEFTVVEPSLSLEVGERRELTVEHAPISPGAKQDTLQLLSNDPDSPQIEIALSSHAVVVDPCSAVLEPATIDLGLVGVGEARAARFYARNTGAAACLVREVRLIPGPGAAAEVRLLDPPAVGSTIEPGATRVLEVEVAPQVTGTRDATLELSFSNPGTNELSATVHALAGVTPLSVEPPVVDFGPTPLGCAIPDQRRLTLRRVAGGSGRVLTLSIQNDASGSFSVAATPAELAFWQTLAATVSYDPQSAGRHTAELYIFTDSSPTPIVVPLAGEGVASTMRSETTVLEPRAIDLLFLVDNSCSMGPAQEALAAALPVFDQVRLERQADVRAAVITTDMKDPSHAGRFQGVPPVMDGASPAFLADLTDRVIQGTEGSGNEMGILALYSAFREPLSSSDNAGFIRPDADLALVVVTDENDFSPNSPGISAVVATVRSAAGRRLITAGVIGPISGTCTGPYGVGNATDRWAELIGRVQDDLHTSFCSPMEDNLRAIAAHLFGSPAIVLRGRPVISTIQVAVDGVQLHPAAWTYDLSTNRVVIFDPADASIGASVEVTYASICLSPTCGDGTTDAGEQCDDMNDTATDACNACNEAVCGDAIVQANIEPCDDGNLIAGDACLPGCIAASCGDGALQMGVEACDDGNTIDGDGCPSTCRFYTLGGPISEPYVPLIGGSTLTFTGSADPFDDGEATIVLPFGFSLFDVPSSTLTVSVNGFVSTTNGGPQSWVNDIFPAAALPDGVMAPWWDDLYLDEAIDGGAAVSWAVLGAAPSRTAVIEWRDLRLRGQSTEDHRRFTFQLQLEEGGTIRFAYADSETAGVVPSVASASAGIEDPAALRGVEALGCSPNCDGRPRPPRADGFPVQAVVTFAP
jgi:cysteine-rich repeat protein